MGLLNDSQVMSFINDNNEITSKMLTYYYILSLFLSKITKK